MIVNGIELKDLDTFDPDVLELIENASDKVMAQADEAKKCARRSESVRMQCRAIDTYIDTLFGEGSARKIFGEKSNLNKSMEVFGEINRQLDADADSQTNQMNKIVLKYTPKRVKR